MHQTGNILTDLEFQDARFFEEVQSWTTTATSTETKASQCGSDMVLGGPSAWKGVNLDGRWRRTYTNLPEHTSLTLQVKVFLIDQWEDSFASLFYFNQHKAYLANLVHKNQIDSSVATKNLCGSEVFDIPPFLMIWEIPHSGEAVTFEFVLRNLNAADNSFGMRDLIITLDNKMLDKAASCGVASFDLGEGYACACPSPLTPKPTESNCAGCDSSCLFCNKQGPSGCLSCVSGKYLTFDGKCMDCAQNCQTCSGTADFCTSCESHHYQAGNSCYSTCPDPLIKVQIGDNWFCKSPCESPEEFVYWDGESSTCISTCNQPLVQRKIASHLVCTVCREDEYFDPTVASQCTECHSSCSSCFGGTANSCTTCPLDQFLTDENECSDKCSSNCETCSEKAFHCTTCDPKKYLNFEHKCADCHPDCKTCSGATPDSCTSCPLERYLTDENECSDKCSSDCETCFEKASHCTSCKSGKYLADNICVDCHSSCLLCNKQGPSGCISCVSGKYLTFDGKCMDCAQNCQTCSGTADFCTSCESHHYQAGNSCYSTCPDPLIKVQIGDNWFCKSPCESPEEFVYWDGESSTCISTCNQPLVQRKIASHLVCTVCREDEYFDPTVASQCTECHSSCSSCFGGTANSCTTCPLDQFLTDENECSDKCSSNCETCSEKAFHCTTCDPKKYLNFEHKCADCHPDCKTCSGATPDSCTSCPLERYLTDENECSDKCSSDCETCFEKASHCTSCKSEKYLADNECVDCHTSCSTCSGGTAYSCISCNLGSYLVGSTCYDECPDPLIKIEIDNIWHCTSPCQSTDYIHWNGKAVSCQTDCTLPWSPSKIASYLICARCGEDEYMDDSAKICKTTNLPGQFSLVVEVDNNPTKVTFIDKVLGAENIDFNLLGKDYIISSSWTFFGLNSIGEYTLDNWNVDAKCGCFRQVCGKDCVAGVECHDNSETASSPWLCSPWSEKNNYCWSLVTSGQQAYTAYNLSRISTIALTSYGGPDAIFVEPGFTITDSLSSTQNYALNAMIINLIPRRDIDLASSYRYAESEGQVITSQHFANLSAPPKINANLSAAACNSKAINFPLSLTYQNVDKTPIFHAYTILRRGGLPKLTTLSHQDILTPNGVLEWNNQPQFDIVDPCNQQFLTLQRDPIGNFFVKLPASQRFTSSDDIICIAINDVSTSQYDLVLYELKNKSPTWFASDRFVGLISKDYVQDLTLRIATKADKTITLPDVQVKVEFSSPDVDPPFIQVTTSMAITCQIYLSPRCSFPISTTQNYHFVKYSYSNCGFLYEKAGYNCQGVTGYFYPPSNLVRTPINQYVENTTFILSHNQNYYATGSSYDDQDFLGGLLSLWTHWTWQNAPNKVFNLLMIILFLMLCFKTQDIFRKYKIKRLTKLVSYDSIREKEHEDHDEEEYDVNA